MKKEVKVKIKWNKDTAIIETEHGLSWSFKCPKSSSVMVDNYTSVSSLASALLTVTIGKWVESTKANSVCFTLTAEDIFQAERNID